MPRLSVLTIKASFVYLVAGFTLGAMMLIYKVWPIHPVMWWVLKPHVDFLLFGWTLQLAMGVAYWILPKFGGGASRGNVPAAQMAFVLLNGGVVLAGVGPLAHLPPWTEVLGRIMEFGSVVAFAVHAFPRVKPFRNSVKSNRA